MTHHSVTGGALRLSEPTRTLIAAEDGIYLWPGILLVHKGCAINRNNAYEQLARFYGPSQMLEAKLYDLEDAARFLTRADVVAVQHGLDMLEFPPISPNGALLMSAIAKRQRLPVPGVPVNSHQYGTRWDAAFAAQIAPLFDDLAVKAQALAKHFVPGVAKGYDPDEPRDDHGRWTTGGATSGGDDGSDSSEQDKGDGSNDLSTDAQAVLDGMSAASTNPSLDDTQLADAAGLTGTMNDAAPTSLVAETSGNQQSSLPASTANFTLPQGRAFVIRPDGTQVIDAYTGQPLIMPDFVNLSDNARWGMQESTYQTLLPGLREADFYAAFQHYGAMDYQRTGADGPIPFNGAYESFSSYNFGFVSYFGGFSLEEAIAAAGAFNAQSGKQRPNQTSSGNPIQNEENITAGYHDAARFGNRWLGPT